MAVIMAASENFEKVKPLHTIGRIRKKKLTINRIIINHIYFKLIFKIK